MILIHSEGHWKGWVLKTKTFLGPEMNAKNSRAGNSATAGRQATEENPGVVDTCGKFAAGVVNNSGKIASAPGTLILVTNKLITIIFFIGINDTSGK